MRRYLVVANQTLCGEDLVELINERAQAEPSEFFIVVPAVPVMEMRLEVAAMPYMGGIPLIPASPEQARALAQERLAEALTRLKDVGATIEGQVGDLDPVRAVQAVLKDRPFDEIIVSTLPKRISRWLRQDLPCRLEKCGLPVTHVEATKEKSG